MGIRELRQSIRREQISKWANVQMCRVVGHRLIYWKLSPKYDINFHKGTVRGYYVKEGKCSRCNEHVQVPCTEF